MQLSLNRHSFVAEFLIIFNRSNWQVRIERRKNDEEIARVTAIYEKIAKGLLKLKKEKEKVLLLNITSSILLE